jgi:hypothetical protein
MKNPCGKTRPADRPYEVWEGNGWTWNVCKKYQNPEREAANPAAAWFCFVTSPFMPSGEYGDVYVSEIKRQAVLTKTDYDVTVEEVQAELDIHPNLK